MIRDYMDLIQVLVGSAALMAMVVSSDQDSKFWQALYDAFDQHDAIKVEAGY